MKRLTALLLFDKVLMILSWCTKYTQTWYEVQLLLNIWSTFNTDMWNTNLSKCIWSNFQGEGLDQEVSYFHTLHYMLRMIYISMGMKCIMLVWLWTYLYHILIFKKYDTMRLWTFVIWIWCKLKLVFWIFKMTNCWFKRVNIHLCWQ